MGSTALCEEPSPAVARQGLGHGLSGSCAGPGLGGSGQFLASLSFTPHKESRAITVGSRCFSKSSQMQIIQPGASVGQARETVL